jgi:peroxiredoxin
MPIPNRAERATKLKMRIAALVVAILSLARGAPAGDAPAAPSGRAVDAVLHLTEGGYAPGTLDDSDRAAVIRWRASAFVSPFQFPLNRVDAIHWPTTTDARRPEGDFCFELNGGDVVFGFLIALTDTTAELEIPRIGRIQVDRSSIVRIYRWRSGSDLIYLGPNGMAGWTEAASPRGTTHTSAMVVGPNNPPVPRPVNQSKPGWNDDSGQLVTNREGASIQGNFGIPDKAVIEFEISWRAKPDFVLAVGIDDKDINTIKRAFRFEAWGSDLVIQRELESEADLSVVRDIPPGPGRAHLQAYLDQTGGKILVCSQGGKPLASLKVGSSRPGGYPGLYLANLRGDLRLEWLRISKWNGTVPQEVEVSQSRVHRADGSIVYGKVTGLDATSKSLLIATTKEGETRIPLDSVASVFLSPHKDEKPRALRAACLDGTRLSGQLERVRGGAIELSVPGFRQPAKIPIDGLRSLVATKNPDTPPLAKSDSTGRLELGDLKLSGNLVDGVASENATCLVWRPLGSEMGSALKPGVGGRIIYREPAPVNAQRQAVQTQQQLIQMQMMVVGRQVQPANAGAMVGRFLTALAEPTADVSTPEERRALFLRDGDVIPSTITKIDADGVWFKSSLSPSTFVPNAKVKAVELAEDTKESTDLVKLTKGKRDRLLTLPRMQKNDPPTHLIRSKNGDFLRGRVASMDATTLAIEIRLESRLIPRDRISRIIWLHSDELDVAKKPAKSAANGRTTRVQALRNDGVRLTFQPERFEGSTLYGKSEVLGACQVTVAQVDQLLIESAIEQAAALLTYQQWKLKNAPDPKYVTAGDGDEGGGSSGTESPLVGKPAPDFTLDLKDGGSFHLAESKGKEIVVLDFWATWCGPCLQAMPQVERAVAEFKAKNVRLVAVNLQETAEQVTALLDRIKLHVPVALDRDGIVADKYKAVAIPQTVIIGRDGNVARLFVGGGPRFEEQLKQALKEVADGPDTKQAVKP